MPMNKFLDPKKSAGTIHERVYLWRQHMVHHIGAHIRIAKEKRESSNVPFQDFVSQLISAELRALLRTATS